MKQSYVVIVGVLVEIGMADDRAHTTVHAVGVAAFQVLKTQYNRPGTGVRAETMTAKTP